MKQFINILAFVGSLSLFMACEKVKDTGADIDLNGTTHLNASVEDILIPGAETSLWGKGDRIGVFASEAGVNVPWFVKKDGIGASESVFYGEKVKGKLIRAYYPYVEGLDATFDAIPCDLASKQVFEPGIGAVPQFLRYADRVFAHQENGSLHFAYPFGMLQVEVQLEGAITVKEMALFSDEALSGRFVVDREEKLSGTSSSAHSISLMLPAEGVPARLSQEYSKFLFVLPPRQYERIDLRMSTADGETLEIRLKDITIPRIENQSFQVAAVSVGISGIPELNPENGYLEVL